MMGVVDHVFHLLCILIPCSSSHLAKDAVWRSVATRVHSESESRQHSECQDTAATPPRIRKRWASSPKSTPGAMGPISPQLTPIEKLFQSIRSPTHVPSMSDMDVCMPEMSYFSRILSTIQVSTIFLSLPPRIRLHPWTLLFSLSRDGCSLKNLYSRLASFDCTVLLVIQVCIIETSFGKSRKILLNCRTPIAMCLALCYHLRT